MVEIKISVSDQTDKIISEIVKTSAWAQNPIYAPEKSGLLSRSPPQRDRSQQGELVYASVPYQTICPAGPVSRCCPLQKQR